MAYRYHVTEAKGILSAENGMNLYRGCTHGCIYCDSRSKCYQFTHDFEDIEVKGNGPELLAKALSSKRKKCMIGTGAMCDPYLHIESQLQLTRKCLEIIAERGFGLAIQTKSDLILRDLDLLKAIHAKAKCVVQMTITTWDEGLCRILEPNVCTTKRRLAVLSKMREAGIPTVVWLSPILPFINDTEENIESILAGCKEAGVYGVLTFGMGLTLREGNREFFYEKLKAHFPGLMEKYHEAYGYAYEIPSPHQNSLMELFYQRCAEYKLICRRKALFSYLREFPREPYEQMSLF